MDWPQLSREPLPGDQLNGWSTGVMWAVVFVVVAVLAFGLTPWDAITQLLASGGVGEDEASLIGFVAGYTLPLTVGVGIIAFGILTGAYRQVAEPARLLAAAVILFAAGWLATALSLGRVPEYTTSMPSGNVLYTAIVWVLQGYLNAYGWSLAIASLVIGFAVAIHLFRLMYPPPAAA